MNTGNTVPQGGLMSYLSQSFPQNNTLGMQTSTPASSTPTYTTGSQSNTGLTSATSTPSSVPLISQVNPNADAILKAHSATLKSISAPQQSDPTISGMGAAQTPAQMAAAQGLTMISPASNGMAAQYGSSGGSTNSTEGSTSSPVVAGTLGTGSPSAVAANQTPSGLLGNLVGQSQGLYKQENALNTPYIKQNQDTIANATAEIAALEGGSYSGTAQDYIGRTGQLQNVIAQAQANINSAQANLGTFSGQAQTALGTGLTAATTGANVTAPAGEVTTNSLTGAQYSNPALAPVGTQSFYSPQPNGTPNGMGGTQPATAGQSQQYAIKSGDTFNSIAAANGTTAAALEAANPGMTPTDLQVGANMVIPSSASGSNTPFTGGQANAQANQGATYQTNNGIILAAQGIQQKINADISENGINSLSSLNLANAVNQWIQGNVSNPAYQNFFQDLTDYTQTIAPLIGVSGTITDMKTAIGQNLISATASGQTIEQGLANLNALAINKNNALKNAGSGGVGQGALPSGQESQNSSGSGSVTTSTGTYTRNPTTGLWQPVQ